MKVRPYLTMYYCSLHLLFHSISFYLHHLFCYFKQKIANELDERNTKIEKKDKEFIKELNVLSNRLIGSLNLNSLSNLQTSQERHCTDARFRLPG